MAFVVPALAAIGGAMGATGTAAVVAGGMTVAGMAATAYGGYASAQAAKAEGRAAQAAANAEAVQAERQAMQERGVASFNADKMQTRVRQILSEQRVIGAAGGGDTTDQTSAALRRETVRNGTMEELLTLANAEDRARQMEYSADTARRTGRAQRSLGNMRANATLINTGASLLSTAGSMKWGT